MESLRQWINVGGFVAIVICMWQAKREFGRRRRKS